MLEIENVPAIGEVAAVTILLGLPELLELVAVGVVVTTAALLKPRHLPDLGTVTPEARHLSVLPRQFEGCLVVVKGALS